MSKRKSPMLIPTIFLGILAAVLLIIAYSKGNGEHIKGLEIGFGIFKQIIPLLVFVFIVAGLIQVLIPKEMVARWVGAESGFRGIMIGSFAGALAPGGPFVSLPIAAGLLKSGASIGTIVAFITGWSLWSLNRIPMEVGILGWKVTLIRFVCTLLFPPLAGLIAQTFFSDVK